MLTAIKNLLENRTYQRVPGVSFLVALFYKFSVKQPSFSNIFHFIDTLFGYFIKHRQVKSMQKYNKSQSINQFGKKWISFNGNVSRLIGQVEDVTRNTFQTKKMASPLSLLAYLDNRLNGQTSLCFEIQLFCRTKHDNF